ncbi:mannose-1-phosphate guanylyltransferase/mannose-6-phosphate isomerase [Burkholderia pseudomallei]|uniref:mannose-1-phosphate guanylyltransferase/mannose-6-phosphate isomerase n=1 Tax=Burkholderia pseudomallei TaxID=28450 RepID=UPI000A1A151A|nr:mannose-1-phosphate guanylyltransferase/mannose-6-phosphate isomerase [Burkholderia pseudomallei]ARK48519.1 mannose-1-phosphate guanylyltransferase/mannose-6-phosphate isomerase [Burkholderia pseudomallei]ARL22879.1 mannose-1-phosphate guanylyltransferase/mannose-6-phosphate isomerase [Burkholderia pseudomallei]ARL29187.1 mannose-1-phosphate guanylyltransferase/mannose-6-phosphate isomerase [Burkholderia pseudomallei]ARL73411.1 mannose-1-phosphate guanylyltransferase/mannose-6-phosphate isom
MTDLATKPTPAASRGTLPRILPVILAGGSGTRLWPLSREHHPKQLIDLIADESPLSATARRLTGIANAELADALLLVCGEQHRFTSAAQVSARGLDARILLEPAARNTAPALTLAALEALAHHGDPVLAAMPADHAVSDTRAFQETVALAARYAQDGAIVTLGVLPRRAETGYGYIKVGAPLAGANGATGGYAIDSFVEKPHQELAQQYLQSGDYWWNSGIFVVRASTWLAAIRALQPDMHAACEAAWRDGTSEGAFFKADAAAFAACPSDSIDYAVMERLTGARALGIPGVIVPLTAGWSDVGSWDAIWELLPKDEAGNVARGEVLFEGTEDSFARSEGRLVACVGLKDVVVVETPDAVLVANKHRVQDVKTVVARLKSGRHEQVRDHRKVQRPWGYYDSIDRGERFQVKRIVVDPGKQLSLQMHYHRAEHWIVVRGTAKVTRGDETFLLSENESTYIAVGAVHRLENPGRIPLEIIEVQSGDYLGEDDIVRFDDRYGRASAQHAPDAAKPADAERAPAAGPARALGAQ